MTFWNREKEPSPSKGELISEILRLRKEKMADEVELLRCMGEMLRATIDIQTLQERVDLAQRDRDLLLARLAAIEFLDMTQARELELTGKRCPACWGENHHAGCWVGLRLHGPQAPDLNNYKPKAENLKTLTIKLTNMLSQMENRYGQEKTPGTTPQAGPDAGPA